MFFYSNLNINYSMPNMGVRHGIGCQRSVVTYHEKLFNMCCLASMNFSQFFKLIMRKFGWMSVTQSLQNGYTDLDVIWSSK